MNLEVSTVIERPVPVVWEFYAVHHVENHPRWDPSLELEATSEGPVGVGTVIKRRATRFGTITEGTMEIVAFEPGREMRVDTHDGPTTIHGWAHLEAVANGGTRLTIGAEFPGIDESMARQVRPLMERSAANIKSLIEAET